MRQVLVPLKGDSLVGWFNSLHFLEGPPLCKAGYPLFSINAERLARAWRCNLGLLSHWESLSFARFCSSLTSPRWVAYHTWKDACLCFSLVYGGDGKLHGILVACWSLNPSCFSIESEVLGEHHHREQLHAHQSRENLAKAAELSMLVTNKQVE